MRVQFLFLGHLSVLVMPQFFGVPQFSSNDGAGFHSLLLGGGGSAREALEYGHGVISSAQSTLFLSSLVQAIAYHVVHQFGALGTLYSLLCWSFSSRCHPYFHGSLSHYDGRPRSVVCFWSLRYMVVFIRFWSCSVLCMPGILREDR